MRVRFVIVLLSLLLHVAREPEVVLLPELLGVYQLLGDPALRVR